MPNSYVTSWTVARQVPLSMGFLSFFFLSMGFLRQEYGSGLLFPFPGDLPNPGIKPTSPVVAGRFFTTEPPG